MAKDPGSPKGGWGKRAENSSDVTTLCAQVDPAMSNFLKIFSSKMFDFLVSVQPQTPGDCSQLT